jgi:hypothetical protein
MCRALGIAFFWAQGPPGTKACPLAESCGQDSASGQDYVRRDVVRNEHAHFYGAWSIRKSSLQGLTSLKVFILHTTQGKNVQGTGLTPGLSPRSCPLTESCGQDSVRGQDSARGRCCWEGRKCSIFPPERISQAGNCSMFTAHCSKLTAQSSLLKAHCSKLTAQSSKLTAHCSLLKAHCSKLTAQSSLLNAHCSKLKAHCSLLKAHYPSKTLNFCGKNPAYH